MSKPEQPYATDALLREVERELRHQRVHRSHREAVLADLRADLLAAAADARDPHELLGDDVPAFVRQTVQEGGYAQAPRDLGRMVMMCLVGAPIAVAVGSLLFTEVVHRLFVGLFDLPFRAPQVGAAVGWVGITATSVLAVLVLLATVLHGRLAAKETVRAAMVTVSVAGVLGAVGNVAVLAQTSHITTGSIAVQVAVVIVPLVLALVTARWIALRSSRGHEPGHAFAS